MQNEVNPLFKEKNIVDKKYRNSFQHLQCCCCGSEDGTVVGAHIRKGGHYNTKGGMGYKPCDSRIIPLCYHCHHEEKADEGDYWEDKSIFNLANKLRTVWIHQKDDRIMVMRNIVNIWRRGGLK